MSGGNQNIKPADLLGSIRSQCNQNKLVRYWRQGFRLILPLNILEYFQVAWQTCYNFSGIVKIICPRQPRLVS